MIKHFQMHAHSVYMELSKDNFCFKIYDLFCIKENAVFFTKKTHNTVYVIELIITLFFNSVCYYYEKSIKLKTFFLCETI